MAYEVRISDWSSDVCSSDLASWLIGAVRHADGFLVNSRATRHDLLRIAEQLGCTIAEDKIEVVPLDADFGRSASPGPAVDLSKWNLAGTSYALMVPTVDTSKNHILALDAWAEYIRIHGHDAIPLLVCPGRRGWR